MEVKSTRFRYVAGKNLDDIFAYIDSLPFKVEKNTLVVKGNKFYQTFIIPDIWEFKSVDLG